MSTELAASLSRLLTSPSSFSRTCDRELRPYQQDPATAIVRSVLTGAGNTFTVMFARQMGKNELSAQLEAYLLTLYAHRGGTIVKAAPSFKPQIVNSILRLKETLEASPLTRSRWHPSFGYMIRLGRASVTFLSADRNANVVGATAYLLLEIDEAQDVDPDKYSRDFRPMASSTNATTVLYGTAWSDDSVLERQRRLNLEHFDTTGEQLHFEYDYTALAALNPHYAAFVAGEIDRLGVDHPSIQTQYFLHTMADAGRLFSEEQRRLLTGSHPRQHAPTPGRIYVAGIDVAGEDENAEDAVARALVPKRDSTVITIAEVTSVNGQPHARVVDHIWWTGRDQVWQYQALNELWSHWSLAHAVIDASGIGYGLAQFLAASHPDRVEQLTFTAPTKSRIGYDLLAQINTGRLQLFAHDASPEDTELWKEIHATRYQLRAQEQMTWSVPDTEGHDDFVIALALVARAAATAAPPPLSSLVRARPPDDDAAW